MSISTITGHIWPESKPQTSVVPESKSHRVYEKLKAVGYGTLAIITALALLHLTTFITIITSAHFLLFLDLHVGFLGELIYSVLIGTLIGPLLSSYPVKKIAGPLFATAQKLWNPHDIGSNKTKKDIPHDNNVQKPKKDHIYEKLKAVGIGTLGVVVSLVITLAFTVISCIALCYASEYFFDHRIIEELLYIGAISSPPSLYLILKIAGPIFVEAKNLWNTSKEPVNIIEIGS